MKAENGREDNMAYLSDIEIAQQCEMQPIGEIARKAHVDEKSALRASE